MRSMYIGSRTSPTVCFTSQLNPIKGEDFGTMSVSGIFIRFSVSSKMMFADDPPSIGILLTNKLAMCKFIRSQVGISVISNRIDVKIFVCKGFYPPLDGNYTSWQPVRLIRRTGLANDTCLWGPRPLLLVGKQAAGTRVASSPDSDLEAFSHNPAHGSFAPLAFQPSAMTNCANQRFLSY
ncbi:hypothetical protein LXL04_039427 [Taraxacum kok-saghyz]